MPGRADRMGIECRLGRDVPESNLALAYHSLVLTAAMPFPPLHRTGTQKNVSREYNIIPTLLVD